MKTRLLTACVFAASLCLIPGTVHGFSQRYFCQVSTPFMNSPKWGFDAPSRPTSIDLCQDYFNKTITALCLSEGGPVGRFIASWNTSTPGRFAGWDIPLDTATLTVGC